MDTEQNLDDVVNTVVGTFHSILQFNYCIISALCYTIYAVCASIFNFLNYLSIVLVELVDQYGDICAKILEGIVQSLQAIGAALNQIWDFGVKVFAFLVEFPNLVWSFISTCWLKTMTFLQFVVFFPFQALRAIYYGIIALVCSSFEAVCGIIKLISKIFYNFWKWVLTTFWFVVLSGLNFVVYVLSLPFLLLHGIYFKIVSAPKESCIVLGTVLLLVLILMYLWKIGVLKLFMLRVRKFCWKIFRSWLSWCVDIVEFVTTIFLPWYPLAKRIALLAYRPILAVLMFVWRCFRRMSSLRNNKDDYLRRRPLQRTPAKDSNLEDRLLCVVCQNNEKTVMTLPCKHLALCKKCANKVNSTCPLCRTNVVEFVDVFL